MKVKFQKSHLITTAFPVTLQDKINYIPSILFSIKHLLSEVVNVNLFEKVQKMAMPVYIFQDIYDYQTPYILAKDFFDELDAPRKKFFTFEKSAHSPIIEEVDKFNGFIKEIILENNFYK